MDHAMHGGARESKGEQEGRKERAVSLPGSSLALILTQRRGNALSTLSFMNYNPTHTHTMLSTEFLVCSDGFPFCISILWLLQINQHQTGGSE